MVKCVALALAVVMLASVAASAMPEIVATPMLPEIGTSHVEVVIDCSQPDCTNMCTAAYGDKLIQAICQVLPVGKLCVCQHKP